MRKTRDPGRFIWDVGDLEDLKGTSAGLIVQEPGQGSSPADKGEKQGQPSSGRSVK